MICTDLLRFQVPGSRSERLNGIDCTDYAQKSCEAITRVALLYNVRVFDHLRQLLTNVKDKLRNRQGTVYNIEYWDNCIGDTGRSLNMRLSVHKRTQRNDGINNHIAEHHLQTYPHRTDWDCAECVSYSTNVGPG